MNIYVCIYIYIHTVYIYIYIYTYIYIYIGSSSCLAHGFGEAPPPLSLHHREHRVQGRQVRPGPLEVQHLHTELQDPLHQVQKVPFGGPVRGSYQVTTRCQPLIAYPQKAKRKMTIVERDPPGPEDREGRVLTEGGRRKRERERERETNSQNRTHEICRRMAKI